jgi:phospholipid/cholesterol/gamma-HCH transport system substrate-binding protein
VYYWLSHQQSEPKRYKIVTGESVGLQAKSAVKFKGLSVGHVQSVHFDKHDPAKVDILFTVSKDTLVTHATYAVMQLKGITGGHSLVLKLGKGSREPLKTSHDNPAQIPLRKDLLARLQSVGQKDLKKINDIISNAQKVLNDKNRKRLAHSIQQIDAATQKIVAIENKLLPTVKMLPALAKSARQTLAQSHAMLAQATQLAKAAKKPIKKAGKAADSVAAMASTGNQLANRLQRETLPDIDRLSKNLQQTSKSVDALAEQLKANPQSLIFGGSEQKPGPGEPGFDQNGTGDSND